MARRADEEIQKSLQPFADSPTLVQIVEASHSAESDQSAEAKLSAQTLLLPSLSIGR